MNEITLCMIVKNEEKSLEGCLAAVSHYMDEIVIVDTGSTDRTKEIALQYTDKVYDFQWNNSFADARNYSLSKASNEFCLVLDADETVVEIHIEQMKKLMKDNATKIGRLLRINEFTRKENSYKFQERVNRFFSKAYYYYTGTIHEQIVPILTEESITDDSFLIPLTVTHSGYEGDLETRKKKTERNINLLKCALEDNPDNPYIIYQLGKSYYMEEEYSNSYQYFSQALHYDLNPKLEYVQDLVESYGYSLINSGRFEEALQLQGVYEEFSGSADFVFLMALIYMNNGMFSEAIEEYLKAAQRKECKMEGVNSYLAFYNIGVIYDCLGDKTNARKFYQKCGSYEPAVIRLKNL